MDELCSTEFGDPIVLRDLLARIGDKWSLFVIGMLESGPIRFTALRALVPGISQRMLTLTLRNLERDGLISRTVYAEVPPRVEYALTPLGMTLREPVLALANWASEYGAEIARNRDCFDDRRDRAALGVDEFALSPA
jgi:DNA-binding HxlR family transcriptional regulator